MGLCAASQARGNEGGTPYGDLKDVHLIEDSELPCWGLCGGSQEQRNQGSTAYDIGKDVQEDKVESVDLKKSKIRHPEMFPSDINKEMVHGKIRSWAHPKDAWVLKEQETVKKSRISYSTWRLKEYQSLPVISTTFSDDPKARKVDLVSLMSSEDETEIGLANMSGYITRL